MSVVAPATNTEYLVEVQDAVEN